MYIYIYIYICILLTCLHVDRACLSDVRSLLLERVVSHNYVKAGCGFIIRLCAAFSGIQSVGLRIMTRRRMASVASPRLCLSKQADKAVFVTSEIETGLSVIFSELHGYAD